MRFLLMAALSATALHAVTISTSATCFNATLQGTTSATCTASSGGAIATAGEFYAFARAFSDIPVGGRFSAQAAFDGDYLLTIHGSWPGAVGTVSWWPMLRAVGSRGGSGSAGGAVSGPVASVWVFSNWPQAEDSAGRWVVNPAGLNPFEFEIGQVIHIALRASASAGVYSGGGDGSFSGFAMVDSAGTVRALPYTLAPIPEPAAWGLVGLGFAAMGVIRSRSR